MTTITDSPELVVLDVGHGNAAVLHEGGATLVIDAACRSHVLEYLKARQIASLDLVILSHSDMDHIAGLLAILGAGIGVKLVILNSDPGKDSAIWRDLVFGLEDARTRGELEFKVGLSSGPLHVSELNRCKLEITGPTPALVAIGVGARDRRERKITSNSISACIRVFYENTPVALLAGDIDDIALDAMLDSKQDLRAHILVFPHHGGLPGKADPTAFSKALLAAVEPGSVIFSIGRGKHDTPRPEILDAILAFRKEIYVACTQLSARCSEQPPSTAMSHLSGFSSAGADSNTCCSGSISIDLQSTAISSPGREAHRDFIKQSVPTPLCQRYISACR